MTPTPEAKGQSEQTKRLENANLSRATSDTKTIIAEFLELSRRLDALERIHSEAGEPEVLNALGMRPLQPTSRPVPSSSPSPEASTLSRPAAGEEEPHPALDEAKKPLSASDITQRLCALQQDVMNHLGYDTAADCFCGHGGFWKSKNYGGTFEQGYRNDGNALRFIENVVRAAISKPPAPEPPSKGETFQVGDVVECILAAENLTAGKHYDVLEATAYKVRIDNDDGLDTYYYNESFKLISRPQPSASSEEPFSESQAEKMLEMLLRDEEIARTTNAQLVALVLTHKDGLADYQLVVEMMNRLDPQWLDRSEAEIVKLVEEAKAINLQWVYKETGDAPTGPRTTSKAEDEQRQAAGGGANVDEANLSAASVGGDNRPSASSASASSGMRERAELEQKIDHLAAMVDGLAVERDTATRRLQDLIAAVEGLQRWRFDCWGKRPMTVFDSAGEYVKHSDLLQAIRKAQGESA